MRQVDMLREHFDCGGSLTVAEALERYGVYALSQRCTDLRREGYPVDSRMVTTPSGKRIAQYFKGDERIAYG